MNDEARAQEPAGLAGVVHGEYRQEVRLLLAPAVVVLAVFAAALAALFRWSVLEFVPGSLQTGGLTLANFRARAGAASTWTRSGTRWS